LLALAAGALVLSAGGAAAARGPARAHPAAYAPLVQAMVLGAGGTVLAGDRWVYAAQASITVGRRSCGVAGGTPLAVLAAVRAAGGPGFAVRDYGRCNSSVRGSGQLFVYSLGGEPNRGQSGWEYKVEGIAGSAGAADPSGPAGDGRLISARERVLWFWCQARASGCQRTLAVGPARSYAPRGGRLTATVWGQDNEGRSVPIAGARVTLGASVAYSDRHGQATLRVPALAGGYWLTATRTGTGPAFPGWIVAR
jgi:hypothetical protein